MTNEDALLTNAITSYDGIFKGMHDDGIRKQFFQIRGFLSKGDFAGAKDLLKQTLVDAEKHDMDRRSLKIIQSEIDRYVEYRIKDGIVATSAVPWTAVTERPLKRLEEKFCDLPQSVFYLNIGKPGTPGFRQLLGRKLLSDFWIAGKIPELHCSLISAGMILGVYVDQRITEDQVTVHYHALEDGEKMNVMEHIMNSDPKVTCAEVIFPFPLLRESTRKELCSPPDGWEIDEAFDVMLGCGEERIREYTVHFLKSVGFSTGRLYDPACSTGVFLSSLKKAFPESYTIGQDLSQPMANVSKARVDEVHCGNAMTPLIALGTGGVVFNRFLNSEVVKSVEAEQLLDALLPTVQQDGFMITFGHTPVLLSSANFRSLPGFKCVQSIGVAPDRAGVFQYYVIKRAE